MPTDLAADLAGALDAVAFARRAGFEPDAWQRDVLRSTAPRLLLNCCRQSGNSTVTALLALHTAIYQAPALVLALSPSERQSAELLRKVTTAYRALGQPVPSDSETVLRLELTNGSRVIALPGKEQNVRGFSGTRLLLLDEAARIADALYYAVRPMLAVSGGRLVMLSTPWGKRGVFYDTWAHGAGWQRVELLAGQCERIAPEFLTEERASMPDWLYRQEYGCQFVDTEDSVFRSEDIDAALVAGEPFPVAIGGFTT